MCQMQREFVAGQKYVAKLLMLAKVYLRPEGRGGLGRMRDRCAKTTNWNGVEDLLCLVFGMLDVVSRNLVVQIVSKTEIVLMNVSLGTGR